MSVCYLGYLTLPNVHNDIVSYTFPNTVTYKTNENETHNSIHRHSVNYPSMQIQDN